jgi:hypothetical protein
MATAKKAPAKKTVKTTAKKTTAKKTTKKASTSSKVASTASVKPSSKAPLTPLDKLRSVNISAALSAVLFSILTLIFVSSASAGLLLNFQARDAFANLDSVVLGSASEVLVNVEYRFVLVAALLVGGIGSLLLATRLRKTYEAGVKANVSGLRWIFMGLSAALTLEFVSFIGGVQDIATLKTIAALVLATVLFGWISDRENAVNKGQKWLAYIAALFTGFAAWLPLVGSLIGTSVYGGERFGWHVYALAFVTLAGFIGFALNQLGSIKKKAQLEYTVFEQRYLRLDQITKFLIVLITVAALQK